MIVPTLRTERLTLRAWQTADLEPLAAFYANETDAQLRFVGGLLPKHAAWRVMCIRAGHWQLRGFGPFAVIENSTANWAGWCGALHHVEETETEPELLFALNSSFRCRGLVQEAATAVVGFTCDVLRASTLATSIHPDNAASCNVVKRLGGTREGTITRNGATEDFWRIPRPSTSAYRVLN